MSLTHQGFEHIGRREPFVVVLERVWREQRAPARPPIVRWLVDNMTIATDLDVPDRHIASRREVPLAASNPDDDGDEDSEPW